MQLCDGAIFESIAGGYSLVDIANQRVITIPQRHDWEIVAITWIAQDQYQTELWFDPSRCVHDANFPQLFVICWRVCVCNVYLIDI